MVAGFMKSLISASLPLLCRLALFALVWLVITGGAAADRWAGVAGLTLAAVGAAMLPARPWIWVRPLAAARFAFHFLASALLGGIDVALRAVHPRMPLAPGFQMHRLRLPPGTARVMLTNTMSLMPGTLSADLRDDELTLHVLDTRRPIQAQLQRFEQLVAGVFGISLVESPAAEADAQ
jgi:multicomponent Na+:H+ antiporter subunit E